MGYDSSTGVLTYPFTKLKASGKGDLENALNLQATSFQTLFTSGTINPMAKYKPFKNSNNTFASFDARNTARASARYGMSAPPNFQPATNYGTLPPAWSYNKPVYGTDPVRAEDFVKNNSSTTVGYDANAAQPIALTVYNFGIRTNVGCMVWKDSYVNTYYQEQQVQTSKKWYSDRSLSVQELLSGGASSFYDCKVAFAIYNTSSAHKGVNLVVTNKTFDSFQSMELFYLWGIDHQESGLTYPAIPILNNLNYVGDSYTVAVCLCRREVTTGNAYDVITNPNFDCYSLGFDSTNLTDRVVVTAQSGSDVAHLSVTNFSVTETSSASYDSTWMRCYISNASITLKANSSWSGTSVNLQVSFASDDYATVYDGSQIVGTATVTENKSISKNQTKNVTVTLSGYSFLAAKAAGSGNSHAVFSLYGYVGTSQQNKVLLASLRIPLTW